MNLSKDDLAAIRGIVVEVVDERLEEKLAKLDEKLEAKLDEKLEPLREAMRELLKVQIEIVDKIDRLETNVRLLISHVNLTDENRQLRKALKSRPLTKKPLLIGAFSLPG
jgi:hypothetical protein